MTGVQRMGPLQIFAAVGDAVLVEVALLTEKIRQPFRMGAQKQKVPLADPLEKVVAKLVEKRIVHRGARFEGGPGTVELLHLGRAEAADLSWFDAFRTVRM